MKAHYVVRNYQECIKRARKAFYVFSVVNCYSFWSFMESLQIKKQVKKARINFAI